MKLLIFCFLSLGASISAFAGFEERFRTRLNHGFPDQPKMTVHLYERRYENIPLLKEFPVETFEVAKECLAFFLAKKPPESSEFKWTVDDVQLV